MAKVKNKKAKPTNKKKYTHRSELFKINAVKRVQDGETVVAVAKSVKTSSSVVYSWMKAVESGLIGKKMSIESVKELPEVEETKNGELYALRKEILKLKAVINLLLENPENE